MSSQCVIEHVAIALNILHDLWVEARHQEQRHTSHQARERHCLRMGMVLSPPLGNQMEKLLEPKMELE